jgi:hypothetical protein
LTCAHVITLTESGSATEVPPRFEVELDFPLFPAKGRLRARVAEDGWFPAQKDGSGDIAVLELEYAVAGIPAAPLSVRSSYAEREVRVCGYPAGVDYGIWSKAQLGRQNVLGWVQLDAEKMTGQRIERGFSGAGVTDEADGSVVGIIVAELRDPSAKVAWMLPVRAIAEFWPPLGDRVEHRAGVVSIGPLELTAIAECSAWDSSHEISAVTASGGLLRRWWDRGTGWSHWHDTEVKTPVQDVATVSFTPGRIICVIADVHGRGWWTSSRDRVWDEWHQLRAPEETDSPSLVRVAAVSKRDGHHEIFAVTGAGELLHRWGWELGSWSDWRTMSTPTAIQDVAASSSNDGVLECMVTDVHGRAWRRSAVESDWAEWHKMRLPGTTAPTLVRVAATRGWTGHHEIFAVTGAGELVHRWWWEKDGWSEWYLKETPIAVSDVSATSNTEGHIECVIVGVDGTMWQQSYSGEWSPFDIINDLLWTS